MRPVAIAACMLALAGSAGCRGVYRVPGSLASLGAERAPGEVQAAPARPATARPPTARPTGPSPAGRPGEAVAAAACGFEGARSIAVSGVKYRFDCSGLVEAALASAGFTYAGSARDLFASAKDLGVLHRRHRPDVGDVAFFDDTYDRDGDGRVNDPLTHVAVVVRVDGDGTIGLVHLGSAGVVDLTMNLRDPETHVDDAGRLINDYLRAPGKRDSARTRRLAGELWVAFASFWKVQGQA